MQINEIIQIVLFFGIGIALAAPLGGFMARVFKGERTFLHPVLQPVENLTYRLTGIDFNEEMSWIKYFWAVIVFAYSALFGRLFPARLATSASVNR